jgi:predicted regulator of Ras-like GTPase activity (Roadblock/LC7/MglB family)
VTPDFQTVLDRLTHVRGVRGALVVDAADGLPLASALRDDEEGGAVAALAGALAGRLQRAADAAGLGAGRLVQLRGERGLLCAAPVAGGLLLVVLGDASANLGLVRLALMEGAEVLAR